MSSDLVNNGGDEESGSSKALNWTPMNVNGSENPEKFRVSMLFDGRNEDRIATFATNASWAVNWFLLVIKAVAVVVSGSKAVAAALADSAVDLVSQFVLAVAERYMGKHNPDYPVGRSRLEALSVLACASIMTIASVEVIQYSIVDLYSGLTGHIPKLVVDATLYTILGVGVMLKMVLYLYCIWVHKITGSDTLHALAEDHLNDVFSNIGAVATAAVAANTRLWWFDPVGAIVISIVIIYRWVSIMNEQVKKIVGHTAPPEFIQQVETLAKDHDPRLSVDCTRAYHFGARFNVEMEIVLPGTMTVIESHDIALALQHKIEKLDDVERAFVHVDHDKRDGLEHKIERALIKGSLEPTTPGSPSILLSTSDELRQRRVNFNSPASASPLHPFEDLTASL